MKLIRIVVLACLFCVVFSANAQQVIFSGKVKSPVPILNHFEIAEQWITVKQNPREIVHRIKGGNSTFEVLTSAQYKSKAIGFSL
ncbi:hypothetical protein U9608_003581 [Vibrio alginolyticus]|uniref:hypothetical protein n=1 Tax=Vibrio TaxID=662 RepID=UPI00102D735F|nr:MULTISPECIES: hypothetical protein [Vibrio]EMB9236017.1 hypothetical protein [Vibrio alginolyticus]MCF7509481.1 hypothetical protein [Vibrio sp. D54]RZV16132.1 hypothetical protein EOJ41_18955 [Vibrio alginolyticus]